MEPWKLNKGSKCTSYFCPTLFHVEDLLSKLTILKQPRTIFLHCGTNHINSHLPGMDWIEDYFIRTIHKLKEMFPGARIILSSLLPRKTTYHNGVVLKLNDFLHGVSCSTGNVYFMRNLNIKRYMLVDEKHINEEGFNQLVNNLRFTIFGKIT